MHDTRNTAQPEKAAFSVAQPRDDRSALRGTPAVQVMAPCACLMGHDPLRVLAMRKRDEGYAK